MLLATVVQFGVQSLSTVAIAGRILVLVQLHGLSSACTYSRANASQN